MGKPGRQQPLRFLLLPWPFTVFCLGLFLTLFSFPSLSFSALTPKCSSPPQEPGPPRPPLPKSYIPLEPPPTVPPLPSESRPWPYPTSPSWQRGGESQRGQVPEPLQGSPKKRPFPPSLPSSLLRGWYQRMGLPTKVMLGRQQHVALPFQGAQVPMVASPCPLQVPGAGAHAQDRDRLLLGSWRRCKSAAASLLSSALSSLAVLSLPAAPGAQLAWGDHMSTLRISGDISAWE